MMNKLKRKKFSMEDVKAAHALKPYLPVEKLIKQFAFLNLKISQGWDMNKVIKHVETITADVK